MFHRPSFKSKDKRVKSKEPAGWGIEFIEIYSVYSIYSFYNFYSIYRNLRTTCRISGIPKIPIIAYPILNRPPYCLPHVFRFVTAIYFLGHNFDVVNLKLCVEFLER